MARPSRKLQRFVELYTKGPQHIVGNWAACASAAGMNEPPDKNDTMIRRMVEAAGGVVVGDDIPLAPLDPLTKILTKVDEGIEWKKIRSELSDVIRSVATGEVQARAAQVAMLKFVIEKAEKEAADAEEVHGVVVLPTQGSGKEMRVDEEWMRKIKAMETPAE